MAISYTESVLGLRLITYYPPQPPWYQTIRAEQDSVGLGFLIGNSGSISIGSPQSHFTSGIYDNIGNRFWLLPSNPEWSTYTSCNTANNSIIGGSGNRFYGSNMFNNTIIGGINNKIISGSNNYVLGISGEIKTSNKDINAGANLLMGIKNKIYGSNNILFGLNNIISNTGDGHTGIIILGGENNCTFSPINGDILSINSIYNTSNKITKFYNESADFLTIINGINNKIGGDYSVIYNGTNNILHGSGSSIINASGSAVSADFSFIAAVTNSRIGGKDIFVTNSDKASINYEGDYNLSYPPTFFPAYPPNNNAFNSHTGEFIQNDIDIRLIGSEWVKQGLKSNINSIGNCANYLVGHCFNYLVNKNNDLMNLFNGVSGINWNNSSSTIINYQSYNRENFESLIINRSMMASKRNCNIGILNSTLVHVDGAENRASNLRESTIIGRDNDISNSSNSFIFGNLNSIYQGDHITLIGTNLRSQSATCWNYAGSTVLGQNPPYLSYDGITWLYPALSAPTGNSLTLAFDNGIYVNTKSGFYLNGMTLREKIDRSRDTILDSSLI